MSKYESKANELLNKVQSLLDAFKVRSSNSLGDDYFASVEITNQYPDLLLDIQTLLFCDSPQNPLYIASMKLNDRRDKVLKTFDRFQHFDFVELKKLLSKYIEYRQFLEAED